MYIQSSVASGGRLSCIYSQVWLVVGDCHVYTVKCGQWWATVMYIQSSVASGGSLSCIYSQVWLVVGDCHVYTVKCG